MKLHRLIAGIFAVTVTAAFVARGDGDSPKNQGKTSDAKNVPVIADGALKQPIKSVLDHYLKIQQALADDSINGISANAAAISKAVKADQVKTLPSEVANDADALVGAKDLATARETFKDLSQSLIKFLSEKKVNTGEFDEVFCPMQNAYWLQASKDIANPYLGHSMPGCGEIKGSF